eukprot:TRINITY_DN6145_c0_g1_i7.p1 TRINITY_DN6145_c0_g1~~TRINITY_DN6145_c0_g1_i7.p1  ORF type:complete len:300 (-),score=127.78 TRINITY_DN6145_c0_g1_i7:117-1016(-)
MKRSPLLLESRIQVSTGRDQIHLQKTIGNQKQLTNENLNTPIGVSIDNDDNIYVADSKNHCIRIYNKQGELIKTIGGRQGNSNGCFNEPWGITIDNENKELFVTDCKNHRIQIFDCLTGRFKRKFDNLGNHGNLNYPVGITIYGDRLLIADNNNHRIVIMNKRTGDLMKVFGNENKQQQREQPCNIVVYNDTIFVTDNNNHRIQAYDMDGKHKFQFGSQGRNHGQMRSPLGIAIIPHLQQLIVVEGYSSRLQLFQLDGTFVNEINLTNIHPQPRLSGVAIDSQNRFIIACRAENNIWII